MFGRLKQISRGATRPDTHYECRRCGTTVETPRTDCPACASTDIARYVI